MPNTLKSCIIFRKKGRTFILIPTNITYDKNSIGIRLCKRKKTGNQSQGVFILTAL